MATDIDANGGYAQLWISPDEKAWLNGKQLDIKSDISAEVKLIPGDTLMIATGLAYWDSKPIEARTFEAYHLDRITGKEAWFTQKTYTVRTVPYEREGVRVFPDKLIDTQTRRGVQMALVDGGEWDSVYPIGYHLGNTTRTK